MGKYGNIDGMVTLTNDTIAVENIRRLKAMCIKVKEIKRSWQSQNRSRF